LTSVLSSDYSPFEIVVVDDCSTDDSSTLFAEFASQITLLRTPRNSGFGVACNLGASKARGDVFVFLNDDTTVHPEWIGELIRAVEDSSVGLATPKVLYYRHQNVINAVGGECDLLGFAWSRGHGQQDAGQYERRELVFYGSCCLLVRRNVWTEIKGFDEKYFMYHEDVDLCWRAQIAGFPVLYVPSSIVFHDWQRARTSVSFVAGQIARNSLRTVLKDYQLAELLAILPLHLAVRLAEVVFFSRSRPELSKQLVSGLHWNVKMLGDTLEERRAVQKRRRVSDREICQRMVKGSMELQGVLGRSANPALPHLFDPSKEENSESGTRSSEPEG